MELSQAKLEEMVVGKAIDPTVEFFEQALLDVDASKAAGKRIYQNRLMIKRQVPGVTDFVAQRATQRDITRWPAEYQVFQQSIQARKSPGLEVIYGISNIERQELIDRGYSTVERLATATDVPDHLAHLQPKAQRIHEAIKAEEINDAEEEGKQEDRQQAEELPAPDRQLDSRIVGRPEVPRVPGDPREAREGVHESRRVDRGSDWEVTFTL